MSDRISNPKYGAGSDMSAKRNLPSWMDKSSKKKQVDDCDFSEGNDNTRSCETSQSNLNFSKLLKGVVFVLSGFVNPERSTLRSQALEMGAEYQPDWSSDCTFLVCAFPNTPKFRQVESDCGPIVSKDWITECYSQKKLVDIEHYLMHPGKPWRKNREQLQSIQAGEKNSLPEKSQKCPVPEKSQKRVQRGHAKLADPVVPEGGFSSYVKDHFSPAKIKEWATDDLSKTMLWLESQEEKPEANELKAIAAEGIITCLNDAIESLKENNDVKLATEQWNFVPEVVKELSQVEGGKRESLSKKDLCELAIMCKKIYEREFEQLDDSPTKGKKCKTDDKESIRAEMSDDEGFDSDQTIEMTEEEIELAQLNTEHCE